MEAGKIEYAPDYKSEKVDRKIERKEAAELRARLEGETERRVMKNPELDNKLEEFLARLTALSHEVGIGLADAAQIFVLDPADAKRYYSYDRKGRMRFVLPEQDQQHRQQQIKK